MSNIKLKQNLINKVETVLSQLTMNKIKSNKLKKWKEISNKHKKNPNNKGIKRRLTLVRNNSIRYKKRSLINNKTRKKQIFNLNKIITIQKKI